MTAGAWTEAETKFLIANYSRMSAVKIARQLGRPSRNAICGKAKRLGLGKKSFAMRKWLFIERISSNSPKPTLPKLKFLETVF